MERADHIFLGIAATALAALVIYDMRGKATINAGDRLPTAADNPMAYATAEGPQYLTYNQPWMFSPPVGNVMPSVTVGQAGQIVTQSPAPTAGCNTCGS